MRVSCFWFALAALAAGAMPCGAQGLVPAAGLSIVSTRVRGTDQLTGTVVGGQGSVVLGRLELALGYVQGKIGPEGAGSPGQDLVEGVALLGVHPAPWLRIAAGPHVRSYTLTGGTQLRWVFWELRARASGAFVGSAGRGYVELWRALAASVNAPEAFDHAQGGEAGMVAHLARAPLELRLGYRVEHAVLGDGTRLETVDGMVIGVGLSGR
jgi:hypothetical protein